MAVEVVKPRPSLRHFLSEQTRLSILAGLLGLLATAVLVAGTITTLAIHGLSPSARIAAALKSGAQAAVIVTAIALGIAASVVGWSGFRRLPTKAAREAAFSGAAIGAVTTALALLFWWFRSGDVDTFARNFFEFSVLSKVWPRFIRGAWNTIILSVFGEAIGILFGLVLAIFVLSRRVVVRAPARAYINFFRGTPLFWQVQFGFFGIVLGLRLSLTPYQVAILILGLNMAAYSAEVFRAGIQSIERGQIEAARAVGMSYFQALRYVILPQGFRRVIPPLTNEFVILIKDTALVSILGLTFAEKELLGVGRDLYAGTFNATPFLASAAGYLIVTLPLIRLVSMLERRLRSGLTGIVGSA
jgi:His/Glu/Gln/Arg/opine family amino acid ABC transporter permease subunit